jgi:tetratricopeptide (TPR) repeat protein
MRLSPLVGVFWTVTGVCLCWTLSGCGSENRNTAALLNDARLALIKQDFSEAERLATQVSEDSPDWAAARLVAGEAATRDERLRDALEYYGALTVENASVEQAALASFSAAELLRAVGQLQRAAASYYRVLSYAPGNIAANERLALLLSTTGQRREATDHYFKVVKSGTATFRELALFGDLDRPVDQKEYLQDLLKKAPADPFLKLGLAAHCLWDGEFQGAETRLREVVREAPQLLAAQSLLGELLVDGDDQTFVAWHAALPADSFKHPDIWYVEGLWARRHGELKAAVRSFWRCTQLAPTNRRAIVQLGQVLTSLSNNSELSLHDVAQIVGQRGMQLADYTQTLDNVLRTNGVDEEPVRRSVELLVSMGRIWEACGWAVIARRQFPSADWPEMVFDDHAASLNEQLPLVLPSHDVSLLYDFSDWPTASDLIHSSIGTARNKSLPISPDRIRFEVAGKGPDFVYENGSLADGLGARMFEQGGGGVGILDVDVDGWPDLFFSQGLKWERGAESPQLTSRFVDRLYRNISGVMYEDASADSLPVDAGFGQGVSVGDFNNDGFPDLYVANIGRNQLMENQGDGTFLDVSDVAGFEDDRWTSSAVIVDVNDDGLPDIVDINYLSGPHVYTAVCQGRACSPSVFEGAPDQLWINEGDGAFELLPDSGPESDSKGLGVLVFPLEGETRPSLFIANDQVPNFFLRSVTTDQSPGVKFENVAFTSGLAFNDDGLAMACMGIAADDANGDGRTDLFVTNFKNEANTLYLQDADGLFLDATSQAGLKAASQPFVGWGTQFLDADLDGLSDLVLVNGDVDDDSASGSEYQMRPQFFRNVGQGRFQEMQGHQAGEFFDRKFVGRGLARLDWNRDGRMDFVVSNIGDRASLVTNLSEANGNSLLLRLHAVRSSRDAICTRVLVTSDGDVSRKSLLAGDGYMASNERVLQFAPGRVDSVSRIVIQWPSGTVTELHDVPTATTLEITEGISPATLWRGTTPEFFAVD